MNARSTTGHNSLIVWQKAVAFAVLIHQATGRYPPSENFGLIAQLRRAAVSVASNIAEGSARRTTREFMHFLHVARGSLAEVQTQLVVSHQVGYLVDAEFDRLDRAVDELARILNAVLAGLAKRLGG
jgi:four helix bundle protein